LPAPYQDFEGQVARDADRRERMVAELAHHHLGRQKHGELGQVGGRQRYCNNEELSQFVF
jgi:hypothetical protein